eukprot:1659372-Rhodomonas_salina.2
MVVASSKTGTIFALYQLGCITPRYVPSAIPAQYRVLRCADCAVWYCTDTAESSAIAPEPRTNALKWSCFQGQDTLTDCKDGTYVLVPLPTSLCIINACLPMHTPPVPMFVSRCTPYQYQCLSPYTHPTACPVFDNKYSMMTGKDLRRTIQTLYGLSDATQVQYQEGYGATTVWYCIVLCHSGTAWAYSATHTQYQEAYGVWPYGRVVLTSRMTLRRYSVETGGDPTVSPALSLDSPSGHMVLRTVGAVSGTDIAESAMLLRYESAMLLRAHEPCP